jgi:EAL domain-containing protein (putative c-di-GMP-specific phosphodiesterase class I)
MLDDGVTANIERALETDGFTVMYQPIISLMGDSQEHYSVLLRLRGEHDRLLTARELLGPAASAGSLPDVDRWVMQRAFQEQARRRRLGQKVSLFLSLSKEIVQDERLLISICDSLREFEIHGSWITFQFQQSEALALGDKWTLLADGLKKIRCRICVNQVGLMDDTERGMETMQADFMKFAPELAIGFATDQAIQKRLLQLINIAQARGVKTIVTGVEDARSLALLWSTGIDYVQGNFLHRALPSLDAPT